MQVGVHTSIEGGLSRAIERAVATGCEALQIFCRNPRSWRRSPLARAEVLRFRALREEAGLWPVVVHASYLINLSSPDEGLFRRSIDLLGFEVESAEMLGADYIVVHPGSTRGAGIEYGIRRVIEALKRVRRGNSGSTGGGVEILLENTAGGGSQTGAKIEHIGAIINDADLRGLGLCFDTCHGFAAGYAMNTRTEVDRLAAAIDREAGLDNLKLAHLNDSKAALGAGIDRHEHIGKGEIGLTGFEAFVNHPALADLPAILETPKAGEYDDVMNMREIMNMRCRGPAPGIDIKARP